MKHTRGGDGPDRPGHGAGARAWTAASVVARGREVRYLQGGDGPRVILLAPTGRARPLARALRARCRVIVPRLPRKDPDPQPARSEVAHEWLEDFLEGIGGGPVSFVSTPRFLARVHRFASFDRDHVLGVAALRIPDGSGDGAEDALAGLRQMAVPVLVLAGGSFGAEGADSRELDLLVSFLEVCRRD